MTIQGASPALYNEDLAPAKVRNWGPFSIFNVWTSDVHSLWGYYLAASLFLFCGSFVNFLLAIGIGSLIIYFLMNMVGVAGVRTGVPFPVLARASFGIWGANFPAIVRAIVACFWYGAQTAAASGAIVALLIRNESMLAFHQSSHVLSHSTLEVICYVVIWALQLLIIQRGMETVRKFQDWAGPAVWVMMLILAIYLVIKAGGISLYGDIPMDVLLEKTKDAGVPGVPGSVEALMAVAAIWVTYFAALYLNFCDFSRYSPDERSLRIGNIWGLPVNLILFSLVAGITTIAAFQVYGEVLLHPDQISAKFDSWFLALLAALTFAVATLGINVVANFVSPAFDFANVFPRHLVFVTKYRRGVLSHRAMEVLRESFEQVCDDFGAVLVELDGEDDHVHLLVEYLPTVQLTKLVNSLKGVSSRMLRKKRFPEVEDKLWGGHLWSPSYCAAS